MRHSLQLPFALVCFAIGTTRISAQTNSDRDTATFVVEHDMSPTRTVARGDTVTVRVALKNVSSKPADISWGYRLFIFTAKLYPQRRPIVEHPARWAVVNSWAKVEHWEFPNPNAPHTSDIKGTTLPPGAAKRAEFNIPFDSVGTYDIKLCAEVGNVVKEVCAFGSAKVVVK